MGIVALSLTCSNRIVCMSVPHSIVIKFVVTGHGDDGAPGRPQRVKYLYACFSPNLHTENRVCFFFILKYENDMKPWTSKVFSQITYTEFSQFVKVWSYVEKNSVFRSGQCKTPDQQDCQKDVRHGCRYIDNLSRRLYTFTYAKENNNPGSNQTSKEFPSHSS